MPRQYTTPTYHVSMPRHHATSACHVGMPCQHAMSACHVTHHTRHVACTTPATWHAPRGRPPVVVGSIGVIRRSTKWWSRRRRVVGARLPVNVDQRATPNDFPLFVGEISPKLSGFVRRFLPTMRKKQIITEKHEIFTCFSTPYSRSIFDIIQYYGKLSG